MGALVGQECNGGQVHAWCDDVKFPAALSSNLAICLQPLLWGHGEGLERTCKTFLLEWTEVRNITRDKNLEIFAYVDLLGEEKQKHSCKNVKNFYPGKVTIIFVSVWEFASPTNVHWERPLEVMLHEWTSGMFAQKYKGSFRFEMLHYNIFSIWVIFCWTLDQLAALLCQHLHSTGTTDNEHERGCIPAITYYTRWRALFQATIERQSKRLLLRAKTGSD